MRLDLRAIAELRTALRASDLPEADRVIYSELLWGYERMIEYSNALKLLEKLFQDKLNAAIRRNYTKAALQLRGHKDFCTFILGE